MRILSPIQLLQLGATPSSPSSGYLSLYTRADDIVRTVDSGGIVRQLGSYEFIVKTANETINNSTTSQNDDELFSSNIETNSTYLVQLFLIINSVTTGPDFKINFTVPASSTFKWTPDGMDPTSSAVQGIIRRPLETTGTRALATIAATDVVATPSGILTTAGTAGALRLQWAQSAQVAENTICKLDSWMLLNKVA